MEVTTALIPSELLARYDALPYDGTYKRADDTLSTVFAEALAAVVNAAEDQKAWHDHTTYHRYVPDWTCRRCHGHLLDAGAIDSRFILKD